MKTNNTKNRGFASMDKAKQREIASKGGKSHTSEHMKLIGHKGGIQSGISRKKLESK